MPLSPVGLITAMDCSQAFLKNLKQLQMIQNAAARVLTKTKRIDFKLLLLVFKSLNGIGPKYLSDMFQQYVPLRSLRSQHKFLLVKPTVQTKKGEAALSHYAVHLWNQLPEDIKNTPTTFSFKSRLKTKLFSDAFC